MRVTSVRSVVVALALLVASVLGGTPSVYAIDSGMTYEPGSAAVVDVNRDFLITQTSTSGSVVNMYIQRISTGARVWLGQSNSGAALCDGAPYLVFGRATASGTVIEARNTQTGAVTSLGYGSQPSAGYDTIAFVSSRDGDPDIWTFDCTTRILSQAVNADGVQAAPAVGRDYLTWTDYQGDSMLIRLRRLGEDTDTVIGEGPALGRPATSAITGNDRWAAWLMPAIETLPLGYDWFRNSPLEGSDLSASNPTTVALGAAQSVRTSADRIGTMTEAGWREGMNDTWYGRGKTIGVRQQTGTPSVLSGSYEIGRQVTSGYTWLTGFALSGNAVYWSENWEGHESSVRSTSLTTNCALTANTTTPKRGTPVVLTARVTTKAGAPVSGAMVCFDAWNGTRWSQLGGGRTYSHGMRQVAFTPTSATRVRARLVSDTAAPTFSWQVGIRPR